MKTYYCPRGCNVFNTYETAPECGACGSRMTEDVEAFEDAHERRELEGIAACERELRQLHRSTKEGRRK